MFRRRAHRTHPHRVVDATPTLDRDANKADVEHLRRFAAAHPGVEAYLEPATRVTGTTVVLVAPSGEWTRRRIGDAHAARSFARKQAVPLHDVAVTGYPARMRDWTRARSAADSCRTPGLGGPSA
ncbi:oxidoreductase [Jatrophihabitans sp. YIM 134969]